MTTLVVIPARWHSSRLPGKPLIPVAGVPLIERVVALARRETRGLADIELVVATDDERIERAAASLGCRAVRSDAAIGCGTSRAYRAMTALRPEARFVVNLQGDAPFVPAGAVARVLAELRAGAEVATPVVALDWAALDRLRAHKRQAPFSGTTCVRGPDGRALWFSKQILPAIRDEARMRAAGARSPVLRHIGLYGYTSGALERFEATGETEPERCEGLEQLRFYAAGVPIQAVPVDPAAIDLGGIDTAADVALAEAMIAERGDPHRR